jgi:hypothetical protein
MQQTKRCGKTKRRNLGLPSERGYRVIRITSLENLHTSNIYNIDCQNQCCQIVAIAVL